MPRLSFWEKADSRIIITCVLNTIFVVLFSRAIGGNHAAKFTGARLVANCLVGNTPDSKVHGANMGPTWVLSAPAGPHVGPTNLAIRERAILGVR